MCVYDLKIIIYEFSYIYIYARKCTVHTGLKRENSFTQIVYCKCHQCRCCIPWYCGCRLLHTQKHDTHNQWFTIDVHMHTWTQMLTYTTVKITDIKSSITHTQLRWQCVNASKNESYLIDCGGWYQLNPLNWMRICHSELGSMYSKLNKCKIIVEKFSTNTWIKNKQAGK